MSLSAWIGREIEMQWRGRRKTLKLKVIAVETAPALREDAQEVWFWTKYI